VKVSSVVKLELNPANGDTFDVTFSELGLIIDDDLMIVKF